MITLKKCRCCIINFWAEANQTKKKNEQLNNVESHSICILNELLLIRNIFSVYVVYQSI